MKLPEMEAKRESGVGGGDPAELESLLSVYLGKVRQLFYPMVCDHALADDLTQETFLRAWRSLDGFEKRCRMSTWLYRIAMNVLRDHQRRMQSGGRTGEMDLAGIAEPRCEPLEGMLDDERSLVIRDALMELPMPLRVAINLTYLQGLSNGEAAEVAQCSLATMYWRVHQAKKQLKGKLEKYL